MQIIYNDKNINLNYLNCYVKYAVNNNQIYFENTLFNTSFLLTGKLDDNYNFLNRLQNGIETNDFINILKKYTKEPEDLYIYLLQNGIIE